MIASRSMVTYRARRATSAHAARSSVSASSIAGRMADRAYARAVIPELVTERLLLRGLEVSDFDAYAAICADPEVRRYLGDGRPLERPAAWREMAVLLGHWDLRGFGQWALIERGSGDL